MNIKYKNILEPIYESYHRIPISLESTRSPQFHSEQTRNMESVMKALIVANRTDDVEYSLKCRDSNLNRNSALANDLGIQ